MDYAALCASLRQKLREAQEEDAEFVARELVAFAANKKIHELLRDKQQIVSEDIVSKGFAYVEEYLAGKPLAYILGEWTFFGADLQVSPKVLIPRDDTMAATELALEKCCAYKKPRVLDLCTGSGCIGIAIALQLKSAEVVLADLSDEALMVANANVCRHGLQDRVKVMKADALMPIDKALGTFDIIVSNPPYITEAEMAELPASVRDFEPHMALYGGRDGLDFYRAICRNFASAVRENGYIIFEFGRGQETAVGDILRENYFEDLEFVKDASNIIRAVSARKKGKE